MMEINETLLDEQLAMYKVQQDQLQAAAVKLDTDYAEKKELLRDMINQVAGASQALDVLKRTLITPNTTPEPNAIGEFVVYEPPKE